MSALQECPQSHAEVKQAPRRKGALFTHSSSFLGEAAFPNLSWQFTFSFIPGGSCLPSPAQLSSFGVSTVVRNTPSIFIQCSLSKHTGRDGGEELTQKSRHVLFRTNGLDYGSWRCYKTDGLQVQHFWDLSCLASTVLSLYQLPLFPCFLLEALHWSTSEVKQALTRPNSCLLLLLWKQL